MSSPFLEETYQRAIDEEVEKRSSTLYNLEENSKIYQREIAAYSELRIKLQRLSETSKALYGFRSPFRNFIGISDGIPEYFTITAERTAYDTEHEIEVLEIARSEKFSSKPFNMKDSLPAGKIVVKIGDEEKTIDFEGGSLVQFQRALTKVFGRSIKTMITQKSRNLQVLTIDLMKTGAKNVVEVVSDDSGIFNALNMFTRRDFRYLGHTFNENTLFKWRDISDNISTNYSVRNDILILNGKNKLLLPFDKEAEGNRPISISFLAKISAKGAVEEDLVVIAPSSDIKVEVDML